MTNNQMLLLYMSDRMNLYDSAKEHRISEKSEVLCFFFLQNGGNYGNCLLRFRGRTGAGDLDRLCRGYGDSGAEENDSR